MTDPLLGKRGRRGLFMLGVLGGLLLVIVLAAIVSSASQTSDIRDTQMEGTPLGKKLAASSERILDCTEPQGECYKRGQRQTAKVVGDIGRYIVLASACAADVSPSVPVDERVAVITTCVTKRLAQNP